MLKKCRLRLLALPLATLLLAACAVHPSRPSAAPVLAAPLPSLLPPAGVYRVDPMQSEVRLLVYRAGALAYLGHNHVIVNRELSGTARITAAALPDDLAGAAFSLTIPVAGFVVDDAQARIEEGADFAADVSDDARSGTLRNMLGAELLDAARFPTITLDSVSVVADPGVVTSTLSLSVAGHRSTVLVPFTMINADGRLIATGRVTLRQSALGLTPFHALLGALAVQDEFDIKFKIVVVSQ